MLSTDYMKSFSEQLRAYCPAPFYALGTDGYGRSDTRAKLRHFFEVSREFVVLTALRALADAGQMSLSDVSAARDKLGIAADKLDPTGV